MTPTLQQAAVMLVAPAACSVGLLWLANRSLPVVARWAAAAWAFAAAFWLGYALLAWLQNRSDFVPERHWQWIPYLTLLAAAVATATAYGKLRFIARWTLFLVTALVSAWLLVPTWPDLVPRRALAIPLLTAYLLLLTTLLEPLADRLHAAALSTHLAITALASAAMIAAFVSLTYGEPATIAAAALAGCAVGARLFPDTITFRSLTLAYSVNVGGWAFTGAIEPRPPLFALLLTPLAPLALWACVAGPLARYRGLARFVIQTAAVVGVIALAGGLAWIATSSGDNMDW
jgi:hypothetical protein